MVCMCVCGGWGSCEPNPLGLAIARPQDKLTCRRRTLENATCTLAYFFKLRSHFYITGMPSQVR